MPAVSLSAVIRQSKQSGKPAPILPASRYLMSGVELARECESATRAYGPARTLSDDERAALAAMLAARIIGRFSDPAHRVESILRSAGIPLPREARGSARDVLRFTRAALAAADVAERRPATRERQIPRNMIGREYLLMECASIMRDSREWRDVAATWESAARRSRDHGPMIESVDSYADSDLLTIAAAREIERTTGEPLAALPLMSADVAEGMALALSVDGAPRRAVGVALCMAAGVPLASVAVAVGRSLITCKRDSAAGAAWMRENLSAAQAVAIFRETADAYGHVLPADPSAPMLPPTGPTVRDDDPRAGARTAPLAARFTTSSTRDLRTIAGRPAERLTPADPAPFRDAAPLPAATARHWMRAIAGFTQTGHADPAAVAVAAVESARAAQ